MNVSASCFQIETLYHERTPALLFLSRLYMGAIFAKLGETFTGAHNGSKSRCPD